MGRGWAAILLAMLSAAMAVPRAGAQNADQQNPPQSQTQTDQNPQNPTPSCSNRPQQDQTAPEQHPTPTPGQATTEDQSQPQKPVDEANPNPPSAEQKDQNDNHPKPEEDKSADKDKKDEGANPAQAVVDKTKDVTNQAVQQTKEAAQATLTKVRDWETEWLIGAYVGRNRRLVPLTLEERKEIYLKQTFLTPGAYLKRMFDAGIDQARGSPRQWDGGFKGYLERWSSREGQFFASNSLAALGNAKLHYEVRYDQCRCHGFWPRTRHAIARNFLTYNQTEAEMRPQWALYVGAFGGGIVSTAWKPKPRNAFAEGGRAMLGQAGYGILLNFFTEFAVDINRKLGAQKPPE